MQKAYAVWSGLQCAALSLILDLILKKTASCINLVGGFYFLAGVDKNRTGVTFVNVSASKQLLSLLTTCTKVLIVFIFPTAKIF